MTGNMIVIDLLQNLLISESTARRQYETYSSIAKNNGYDLLEDYFEEKYKDETKHWNRIVSKLLYFETAPNVQAINGLNTSNDLNEQLQIVLQLERDCINSYNKAIHVVICDQIDNDVAAMLTSIIKDETEHEIEIEQFIYQIKTEGLENVLTSYREVENG